MCYWTPHRSPPPYPTCRVIAGTGLLRLADACVDLYSTTATTFSGQSLLHGVMVLEEIMVLLMKCVSCIVSLVRNSHSFQEAQGIGT